MVKVADYLGSSPRLPLLAGKPYDEDGDDEDKMTMMMMMTTTLVMMIPTHGDCCED